MSAAAVKSTVVAQLDHDSFRRASQACAWASGRRSSHPGFGIAKLVGGGSEPLRLRAWGPDDFNLQVDVVGQAADPVELAYPSKLLANALPWMEGSVELHSDGRISWADGSLKFGLPPESLDLFDDHKFEPQAPPQVLLGSQFVRAVGQVKAAFAGDIGRPALTGGCLNNGKLIATDTHRMHIAETGVKTPDILIPGRLFDWMERAKIDDSQPLEFGWSDDIRKLVLIHDGWTVYADALEGQYPNWERVVPTEHTRSLTFDRSALLSALNSLKWIAKENAKRIVVSCHGNGRVTLKAQNDNASQERHLSVSASCRSLAGSIEGFAFAFNGWYVADALHALEGDHAVFQLTESSRAFVVTGSGEGGVRCVVMPMALN